MPTPFTRVWYTTQYLSVNLERLAICSSVALDCSLKERRMAWNPTGDSLDTPSVPLKSRSPSADTVPSVISTPMAVATALSVTPAQATNACKSISPEQSCKPVPPVAGCNPASLRALPVSTLQEIPSPTLPWAFRVMMADSGCSRYLSFNGVCSSLRSVSFICLKYKKRVGYKSG